jgi:hypothetical protein
MLVGALAAQRIGWRHSMCDRRAGRSSKIRRLAYRLDLAENQCTGNLPVASDFLVPFPVGQTIEMPVRYLSLNPPCDAHRISGGVP